MSQRLTPVRLSERRWCPDRTKEIILFSCLWHEEVLLRLASICFEGQSSCGMFLGCYYSSFLAVVVKWLIRRRISFHKDLQQFCLKPASTFKHQTVSSKQNNPISLQRHQKQIKSRLHISCNCFALDQFYNSEQDEWLDIFWGEKNKPLWSPKNLMTVQKPAGRTYRDVATKIDTHGIKKKTQKNLFRFKSLTAKL